MNREFKRDREREGRERTLVKKFATKKSREMGQDPERNVMRNDFFPSVI